MRGNREEQPQECPEHGCNSQVYDQNETPLGMLPWYSVQPVQPYIPILLISTCIIQERINYAVIINNIKEHLGGPVG